MAVAYRDYPTGIIIPVSKSLWTLRQIVLNF